MDRELNKLLSKIYLNWVRIKNKIDTDTANKFIDVIFTYALYEATPNESDKIWCYGLDSYFNDIDKLKVKYQIFSCSE